MANFNLSWILTVTANVTGQRAYYRQKTVGGAFLTTGFSPANDLSTSATSTSIAGLLDNVVYQFQIANLCSTGGPTFNANGIQEGIKFACVTPTETHTHNSATGTVSGLPSDITSVIFTLTDAGGTALSTPVTSVTSAGSASATFTGLTPSSDFFIKVEFTAVVNGATVTSALGTCNVQIKTENAPACPAPTNLVVS